MSQFCIIFVNVASSYNIILPISLSQKYLDANMVSGIENYKFSVMNMSGSFTKILHALSNYGYPL